VPREAERLLDQLTVYGTPPEVPERMARWHAAGADVAVVFLRPNLGHEEIVATLEAFGPMLAAPGR
jgi:alkanesulfonate monooxygenase SsuD/methylene tetrahydromethanopterin reductase-like flavin-dependent oxidoreductase (luciferase family)